jgi:hypothetical protein
LKWINELDYEFSLLPARGRNHHPLAADPARDARLATKQKAETLKLGGGKQRQKQELGKQKA